MGFLPPSGSNSTLCHELDIDGESISHTTTNKTPAIHDLSLDDQELTLTEKFKALQICSQRQATMPGGADDVEMGNQGSSEE